ncbi:Putative E3 ubiquitinprotein ligase MYCBP2like [Caligus rogercresseyi]|uniref:E3 ubiquitinprotein ligase MYCBP2like n=1 Tax=Caligus rogercresseyi TaxID=217165 RepID=A0A7T8GVG5_CALRO|nr:Putative E3 ubiquitinprotein ligase MYCBP2like [Caligus rogercresseyi]
MSSGVRKAALSDSFSICSMRGAEEEVPLVRHAASDGHYLYAFTDRGLYKIGMGYAGTLKGHIYKAQTLHLPSKNIRWMGFAEESLFLELKGEKRHEILRLDTESFAVTKTFPHPQVLLENNMPYVMFSDASQLGILTISPKDKFLLKFMDPKDLSVVHEVPLKLAYKRVGVLGHPSLRKA